MPQIFLRLVGSCLFALVVAGCGATSNPTQSGTALTLDEQAWCSEHPEAHGDAASRLSIAFVGDYIRASGSAGSTDIMDLEPPFLAVPSDDNEPLTYRLQFQNSEDSNRACRAAIDAIS